MRIRWCSMCGNVFVSNSHLSSICEECKENCLKNKDKFISEYEELCRKYRLCVDACGCCDSPFLSIVEDEYYLNDHIKHLRRERVF